MLLSFLQKGLALRFAVAAVRAAETVLHHASRPRLAIRVKGFATDPPREFRLLICNHVRGTCRSLRRFVRDGESLVSRQIVSHPSEDRA